MNSKQKSRYNAYALALGYLKENETLVNEVPAFSASFGVAKATLDAITQSENRRQQNGRSVTVDKEQLQENLANQALAISAIIGGYATNMKDAGLRESVSFSPSDLLYTSGQVLYSRCSNILEKANQLAGELREYGVTEALLANFTGLVEQYSTIIHGPRGEKAERKQAGMEIKELLQELDTIFENQLDAFMLLFRFSHREFYNQYMIKRDFVNPAHRKTRIEGLLTDKQSHASLAQVDIRIKGTEMQVETGADGTYNLRMPLLSGIAVVYSKKGYKAVELPVILQRGQSVRLNVEMEKE
jgi:Carboxypeptidase regulatory-like domain